jgi:hypothetical protein
LKNTKKDFFKTDYIGCFVIRIAFWCALNLFEGSFFAEQMNVESESISSWKKF